MTDTASGSGSPDALMFQILSLREEIDRLASRMTGKSQGVFGSVSLPLPKLLPPELGFIRVVSWLFVLYHEAGKIGARFLSERISAYVSPVEPCLIEHLDLVAGLRTCGQHNLDPAKPRDRALQSECEEWCEEHCGSKLPGTDEQWQRCLERLLTEAVAFLTALVAVLRGLEGDGSRGAIVSDWVTKLDRFHPPHEFDELITVVCAEMGRDAIDPITLRRRFYEKWVAELQLLEPGYSFSVEARRLIEHALLSATVPVLPITGADVMQRFGIGPGPLVGKFLAAARKLYDENPCSAAELLDRLAAAGIQ